MNPAPRDGTKAPTAPPSKPHRRSPAPPRRKATTASRPAIPARRAQSPEVPSPTRAADSQPRRITLVFRNRQRSRPIPTAALRRVARHVLAHALQLHRCALGVHFVADPEITRLNESFLHHAGPTDVITFNHGPAPEAPDLHGEIFICVPEALRQARRFRTPWTHEIARYLIHGLLHLRGYDDRTPVDRRSMKRVEDRLLRAARHLLDARPPAAASPP